MDTSIFLARTVGLYLFIVSLWLLIRPRTFEKIVSEVVTTPTFLLIFSLTSLLVGILIIASNNIWQANWQIIITLVGWLAFIKGILGLFFPQLVKEMTQLWLKRRIALVLASLIIFLSGVYLLYIGYA